MNGFGLRGGDAQNQEAVEQFVLNARAMEDRIGLLAEWAAAIVSQTAHAHGFRVGADVPLPDYLEELDRRPIDKGSAFERLCAYFQNTVGAQA